ncbi:TetR/AcrR family transcriptional regulator [Phytomonospora endophytica]|uniref:AcrR family transcriptional regulator n=1 Tax=Phytomonospora endophytica TaxID=714109 RepID=A0A841G1X9_9ACTN|nr:TetR/AcrR family transcriptional regulator [Phytomonospora endophytica]MBB6039928.1 AcrR family transcriptional regulator [Phytomonospora endophytica]GIG71002.1 TetR family transcriptional regulator [Phytomonospora endophytica]
MRADALRNRTAILNAARLLVTTDGPETGMDEIAAAAGVAVGTLYRHFPTKTALVGAVMAETSAQIVARLEAAVTRVETGESHAVAEVAGLFAYVGVDGAHDRTLRQVAAGLGAYRPVALEIPARRLLSTLVDAAHDEGGLRRDVSVDDLGLLMATMPGPEVDAPARERWVALVWRGLVS